MPLIIYFSFQFVRLFPERCQEGPHRGLPHLGRLTNGFHPSVIIIVPPSTRVGGLSRGRSNDKGIHARGDRDRPEMAGRVRARLL